MTTSACIESFERSFGNLTFQEEFSNGPRSTSILRSLLTMEHTLVADTKCPNEEASNGLTVEPSVGGPNVDKSRTSSMASTSENEKVRAASFTSSGDESGLGSRTGSMSVKDSGIESSESIEFPVVPNELMSKVVSIVEWYFSDENLSKDSFLLKHILRNREGYVSLKLVSSLRKVKSVTKDWKTVAVSIRKMSKKLIMNDEISKIKRIDPLPLSMTKKEPSMSKYNSSKLMLVNNINCDKSLEQLSKTFSAYGEISLIRIYRDNNVNPPNTGHLFNNNGGKLNNGKVGTNCGKEIIAIVQYESHESVEKAVKSINEQSNYNWRQSMKAAILADQATFDVKIKKMVKVDCGKINESKLNDKTVSKGQMTKEVKPPSDMAKCQRPFSSRFVSKSNFDGCGVNNNTIRQPLGPDPTGFKGFKRNFY